MSEAFDLRSRAYWQKLAWGVGIGALCAIGALLYNGLVDRGLALVWPNPPSWESFSGSWMIPVIMTTAGVLVGLIHSID